MSADSKTVVYAVTGSIQTLCRLNAKVSLRKLLNVHGCPSKGWSGGSFRGSLCHHCMTGSAIGFMQIYKVKCFKWSKMMRDTDTNPYTFINITCMRKVRMHEENPQ